MLKKIGSDISFSIKKLGKISAGGPIEAIPDKEILELNHIFSNEKCFALKVQGNSMIDAGINDGDWVIIEKNNKIIKSKVLAILIDNQEVTLKFAKLVDKKLIQLIPANKNLKYGMTVCRECFISTALNKDTTCGNQIHKKINVKLFIVLSLSSSLGLEITI